MTAGRWFAAALLVLTACSSNSHPPGTLSPTGASTSPAPSAFTRDCGSRVSGDLGTHLERTSIVVGPLTLVPLKTYGAAHDIHFRAAPHRFFAIKVLALVRRPVLLAVGPGDRDHASLMYDPGKFEELPYRIRDGETRVLFRPCRPATDPEGTQFNGGVIVDGPRCVTLIASWGKGERRAFGASFSAGRCGTAA